MFVRRVLRPIQRALVTLVPLMVLLAAGCGDDDEDTALTTLEAAWPNDEGRFWQYDYHVTTRDIDPFDEADEYENKDDLPAPPPLDVVLGWLGDEVAPPVLVEWNGGYRLAFDGDWEKPSDAPAQYLRPTVTDAEGHPVAAPDPLLPWLRRTAAASPVDRVAPSGDTAEVIANPGRPLLLAGGGWRRGDGAIVRYADLDDSPVWLYLDGDPAAGNHRVIQTPIGVLDVWVIGRASITTPAGTWDNAVRVVYMLTVTFQRTTVFRPDYGPWRRDLEYGEVYYVPEVGPVALLQRDLVPSGSPDGQGYRERRLALTATGLPAGPPH